ncbi:S-layer homology domain-containing protein [Flavonifractor sp. An306]|uniref:S-layer homology domain-containing protein n=1 Tax=Flavonifractor sp. An306 TaxID=1965629 RepID=UPI000B37986E|nr:S-layer homology domain-containing protein [Flavonifractor sp. An306]OUO31618.1 hypothetical protein B5F88_17930 [Flavonifractor sp. An306]
MNGGVEPVVGTKVTPTYSDIKGIWSEKYIEYCTSMGIISGDGTGKFNPTGTLTAEQAAKMFLTAMGYDAKVFGFVGNDWAINVGRYANEAGLYKDLGDVVPSQPITRDDAMQMAYNALQGTMMRRTWSQDLTTGQLTETYGPWIDQYQSGGVVYTRPHTLLADKFNGSIELGYLKAFSYDDTKAQWTYTFNARENFGADAINSQNAFNPDNKTGDVTLKSTVDYTGLFGQQVKVIYNIKKNDVIYGVYANDSSVIVSGATGNIEDYNDDANSVTVAGTDYKLKADAKEITVYNFNKDTVATTLNNLKPATDGTNLDAYTFKMVDNNGDGKIDAVICTPMTVAKINYVGKDSVQLGSGLGAKDIDDLVTYDGYAAGDWVCYIEADYAVLGENTIQKIDLQTAAVSGVRGGGDAKSYTEYQVNGTWLAASKATVPHFAYKDAIATADVNDTIEYVALGSTIFYAKIVDIAATSKNIAMIVTAGTEDDDTSHEVSGKTVKAKLLFADGSTSVVTVSKMDTKDVTAANVSSLLQPKIGTLVTYRLDGSNYELMPVSADNTAGYKDYEDASPASYDNGKVNGFELADDAVIYFLGNATNLDKADDGKADPDATRKSSIFSGKEIKNTWGAKTVALDNCVVLTQEVNGFTYAKVVLMFDETGLPTVTTGSNYGYLSAPTFRTIGEDGKTYLNYTIFTPNGELTVKEESTDAPKDYPQGAVVTYDLVSDGVVKNVSLPHVITGAVTGWDGVDKISLDNNVSEIDATDSTVIYVDSNKKVGVEGGSIQKFGDYDDNGKLNGDEKPNVRYVLSANYVVLLVVDINNEMGIDPATEVIGVTLNGASVDNTAIQNMLDKAGEYKKLDYDTVTVEVPADGMSVEALTVPKDMTLAFTGAGTVTMKGNWTVNGDLTVEGTLAQNGYDLNGNGTVNGDTLVMGSSMSGSLKVTFEQATLKNHYQVNGGTLTINGSITVAAGDGKSYTITVSGDSEVKVAGDAKATLVVNDTANVTVDGTIAGDVTNNGTGKVEADKIDGQTSGNNVYEITPDAVAYIVNK